MTDKLIELHIILLMTSPENGSFFKTSREIFSAKGAPGILEIVKFIKKNTPESMATELEILLGTWEEAMGLLSNGGAITNKGVLLSSESEQYQLFQPDEEKLAEAKIMRVNTTDNPKGIRIYYVANNLRTALEYTMMSYIKAPMFMPNDMAHRGDHALGHFTREIVHAFELRLKAAYNIADLRPTVDPKSSINQLFIEVANRFGRGQIAVKNPSITGGDR